MSETNLVSLAFEDQLEELEQAWTDALASPGEIEQYRMALQTLCERDMNGRALTMASAMVDALAGSERLDDAFALGMTLVRLDAQNDNLVQRLRELIEQRFNGESWYPMVCELAGLGEHPSAAALVSFEQTRRYTKGHVVYHRAGWGEGLIDEFDADRRELVIRFASGRTQEVPLTTAIESMTALDPDDLRSMMLQNKDEVLRLAKEEPSVLIRKVAKVYRGRVTSSEVKSVLTPDVVPTKKWATFWKRAKTAAAVDPFLQVEGSTSRPTFVLRDKPLSLGEEVRRSLGHCDDLGQEVALIRQHLDRSGATSGVDTILAIAQERIEHAVQNGKAAHSHILDGILLLEKHDRHPSMSAASELRAMLVTETGDLHPGNFDLLATSDARQHAVALLPAALGDEWADRCIEKLLAFPTSVVEQVVQLLADRGHASKLLGLWDQVAPYPRRHPMMTYLLGRLYADGAFSDDPNAPDEVSVVRVLLHLARVLSAVRKGDASASRLLTRLTSLFTGRRAFLAQVCENIDRENLASYVGICDRGGADFPLEISDQILRVVARRFPDLTAKPEKPFWEDDAIYVTRNGLAAMQQTYRELVDEKIPANSAAIGAAASLGDLSENSEWESAMEEQRNLTGRATEIDTDLRKAKLLEDLQIPDDVVAPGTEVTLFALPDGPSRTMQILGPWDAHGESIINYLAPFAKALLGKHTGDTAQVPSEEGERQVRVDAIKRIL